MIEIAAGARLLKSTAYDPEEARSMKLATTPQPPNPFELRARAQKLRPVSEPVISPPTLATIPSSPRQDTESEPESTDDNKEAAQEESYKDLLTPGSSLAAHVTAKRIELAQLLEAYNTVVRDNKIRESHDQLVPVSDSLARQYYALEKLVNQLKATLSTQAADPMSLFPDDPHSSSYRPEATSPFVKHAVFTPPSPPPKNPSIESFYSQPSGIQRAGAYEDTHALRHKYDSLLNTLEAEERALQRLDEELLDLDKAESDALQAIEALDADLEKYQTMLGDAAAQEKILAEHVRKTQTLTSHLRATLAAVPSPISSATTTTTTTGVGATALYGATTSTVLGLGLGKPTPSTTTRLRTRPSTSSTSSTHSSTSGLGGFSARATPSLLSPGLAPPSQFGSSSSSSRFAARSQLF